MENNKPIVSGGAGFLDLLQVAFIVLKLTHTVDWSWGIVLIPLWIELGLFVLALIIMIIFIIKN